MKYLEDWGKASIKYCKISLKTKNEFVDDTKRDLFLVRFNVKDYTPTLIDSTSDHTETFDELLALLRRRISRNNNLDVVNSAANAHLAQFDAPSSLANSTHNQSLTEGNARVMRTFVNAATNISTRSNNQQWGLESSR